MQFETARSLLNIWRRFTYRTKLNKVYVSNMEVPPRSALKRTGRIVQKLSSKYFEPGKFAFYIRKVVGLGVDVG